MKKILFPALISAIALYSCNSGGGVSTPSDLVGVWNLSNAEFMTDDSLDNEQAKLYLAQIDSLQKPEPEMVKEFKTNNLDSIKAILKSSIEDQLQALKTQRQESLKGYSIEFKSDGTVIQKGQTQSDTATWYSVNVKDTRLVFVDPIIHGAPLGSQFLSFKVEYVGSDSLRLGIYETSGVKTYVNFKK